MKKAIQIILTIAILVIVIIYLIVNRSQLSVVKSVIVSDVIILFVLTVLFFFITGYTFKLLVSLMEVKLSMTETLGLSIITNFANYLGPTRPGAAFKAMYLKASKNLAYTKFTSVLAASSFLALFMSGGVGTFLLFLLRKENTQIPSSLLFICILLIIGSAFPFVYKVPNINVKGRISKLMQSSIEGFNIISQQKVKLILICFSLLIQFLLAAFILQITFKSLGTSITLLMALFISVFTSISNFVSITPSNLGVQEAVIAYLFTITGFNFTTGVIGAGLLRVIHMIVTFALTPIFSHYLLKSKDLKLSRIFTWKNTES